MSQKIILVGIQGSGKGTQADKLIQDFGHTLIGAGDIFRWLIKSNTTYVRTMKEYIAKGQLVPDELVLEVVGKRLDLHDWDKPMILDGFPRSEGQRKWLFDDKQYPFDAVLHLDIKDENVVVERMMSRGRSDDNEEAIRTRIAEYRRETEPTLEWYDKQGILKTVDALGSVDEIYAKIKETLNLATPVNA